MSKSEGQTSWRRPASCSAGQCIEVAKVADRFLIRDSKNPDAGTLAFSPDEWEAFTQAVKQDEFRF
jgi:hypothetical protein